MKGFGFNPELDFNIDQKNEIVLNFFVEKVYVGRVGNFFLNKEVVPVKSLEDVSAYCRKVNINQKVESLKQKYKKLIELKKDLLDFADSNSLSLGGLTNRLEDDYDYLVDINIFVTLQINEYENVDGQKTTKTISLNRHRTKMLLN